MKTDNLCFFIGPTF